MFLRRAVGQWCLLALALGSVWSIGPQPLSADDALTISSTELDDEWKAPLQKFATFLTELSAGETEAAWQLFRTMVPNPPMSQRGPFDPDPYEVFTKGIGRFPKDLESLTVIGERRFTAKSRRFTLIADTMAGPVVVDVVIFRSKGEWYFGQLNYHMINVPDVAWEQRYDVLPRSFKYDSGIELPVTRPAPKAEVPASTASAP